jgi:MoaA/NifB/PqqE/SkfB family radical SAM enzyme
MNPEHLRLLMQLRKGRLASATLDGPPPHRSLPPPRTIVVYLSFKCNQRCVMCHEWGLNGFAYALTREEQNRMLPLEVFAAIVDDLASHGAADTEISLFGGEPMLHRDWRTMVQIAKAAHLRVNVCTNGLLLGRNAEDVVTTGVDTLWVSIDAPGEIHDQIRRVPRSFTRATEGIEAVQRVRKDLGRGPAIRIYATVSDLNHDCLVELAESLQPYELQDLVISPTYYFDAEEQASHDLVFSQALGERMGERWHGFSYEPKGIDPDVLSEQIRQLESYPSRFPVWFLSSFRAENIRAFFTHGYDRGKQCVSAWREISVLPNGNVTPCLDYTAGNLHENSLMQIWNGERMGNFRLAVGRHGRFPACHRCVG